MAVDAAAKNDRLDRPRSDLSPSSLGAVPQQRRRLGTVQSLRHRCCAGELSTSSAACLRFVARWMSCRPWLCGHVVQRPSESNDEIWRWLRWQSGPYVILPSLM